jgi:hypothetical protein
MIRIYADFNNADEQGRVRLNTVGSLADIERHQHSLTDGMRIILHAPGDFEVEGTLTYDAIWKGVPDWSTIRYTDGV